jgi:C1A family cysteine protease
MDKRRLNHRVTGSSRRELLRNAVALGGMAAVTGTMLAGEAVAGYEKRRKHRKKLTPIQAYDLRKVGSSSTNYISSVKDQGDCNSCTAFAVIAAIEGSYSLQKQQPVTSSFEPGFSESQLFFCNVPKGCDVTAWFPEDALAACLRTGVTDRANNPYDPMNPRGMCKPTGVNWKWTTLQNAARLNNANQMKQWITSSTGGPVIATMVEYKDLRDFNGGESVTYWPANDPINNPRIGGHMLCIVGFDDTNTNDQYWICKNSWGSGGYWNPSGHGYFHVKQEQPNQRMTYIDSFDMWGVVLA